MFRIVFWAIAVGFPIGKIVNQYQIRLSWRVVLTLLMSGIGSSLMFILPERFFLGGVFLLLAGLFSLLASAKGFCDTISWRYCACFIVYFVGLSFINDGRGYLSRIGWNDYRGLFVLPCLAYVIGGGIPALRPLGRARITFILSIVLVFFRIDVIKSGLSIVPAIIGCPVFLISMVAWSFVLKRITPRVVLAGFLFSTFPMLILLLV